MKLSKGAKARIKRMSASERKAVLKSARDLADAEVISMQKYMAVHRACKGGY